jgi:hypothetical protein
MWKNTSKRMSDPGYTDAHLVGVQSLLYPIRNTTAATQTAPWLAWTAVEVRITTMILPRSHGSTTITIVLVLGKTADTEEQYATHIPAKAAKAAAAAHPDVRLALTRSYVFRGQCG